MCGRRGRSAMKDFSEEDLDHYLHNKVDLRRRRVSKMVEEVQKVIQQLTHEISLKDSRFQSISNSGIHNDNIKVLSPAQFLITVPLRGLAGFRHRKARRWRYYSLSGTKLLSPVMEPEKLHQWLEAEQFPKTSRPWHESDVNVEGDLIPAKVIRVFRDLLERSIASCKLSDKVAMLETLGPVVRVAVETSEHQVEVELVPTVEIPTCWSKKSRWPRFLKRWPSKEKVRCVKSFGFNLMARSNYHWQLSFTRAERVLIEGIDEDGGCRLKCFRVIRQLKEDFWCSGCKPVITAHHIQMLLLWSCEKYPRAKDWKNFKKCFLRLFRKLRKCVSQHFLKHYFVRGTNLLKYSNSTELDLMVQKMDEFSTNPAKYIR
ncbi:protein mab-21-like 3 isoform X2 [Ambystoma mexicanum]|uniref:protein mab-21-like 3 isoform X2 n=1 Tax=Ambystoma mexicanum TaxID=8296 RepID=UPI0037E89F60